MNIFNENDISIEQLFKDLYFAKTEKEVDKVISTYPRIFNNSDNWKPLGENENNFSIIENQQPSPIAALIEKITNSIDAILMKKCYEKGIDPKGTDAPTSMRDAMADFYPESHLWNIPEHRKKQAENIQIIVDEAKKQTSIIIYDCGEGQKPEDFVNSFLSLLKGNKTEIHFVQGKYNMGGSGAIAFCGKKRYQLIASKRYDNNGQFGFTLIRKHPLKNEEKLTRKNTWYEYLRINEEIPSFYIDELDLGLYNCKFKTGSIIKLYSYHLSSVTPLKFVKVLSQTINEYLFEPSLPAYIIGHRKDENLRKEIFGLKRILEKPGNTYIEDYFSEEYQDNTIGNLKVTSYVFKTKAESAGDGDRKEENILRNMAVLFTINGQVHGFYTSEFITRSLKVPLLKNHLLIHVNCSQMNYEFRSEIFMASRDRLKDGNESKKLRKILSNLLRDTKISVINQKRKDTITVSGGDTRDLLRNFTKSTSHNKELIKLINQTFKLVTRKRKTQSGAKRKPTTPKKSVLFHPLRFPTYFKLNANNDQVNPVAKIALTKPYTLKFLTNVENQFFDRNEEAGSLDISIADFRPSENMEWDYSPDSINMDDLFKIRKSSPNNGTIKITLTPDKSLKVGDLVQVKATLNGYRQAFSEMFWVEIKKFTPPAEIMVSDETLDEENLNLPEYHLVCKDEKEGFLTWDKFNMSVGEDMSGETIMYPYVEGDGLQRIYINMDSRVLKSFKTKLKSQEEISLAERKYITAVYFHTLFLYIITKKRNYTIKQIQGDIEEEVDLTEYLKDLFESYYSAFLLNFSGTEQNI